MNRRDFAKLSIATLAIAAPLKAAGRIAGATQKPKRLAPGDTLGLVLPASAELTGDEIAFARDQLKVIGFEVVIGAHAYDRWGYLAGHDRDRADDINKMFADDRVAGVVCFTGGWGSPRLLPYLDYDLIARKPKVVIGYSDITALLNAIHKKSGIVTFHGPVGSSTFDPYSLDNFKRVVMTAEPAGELAAPAKKPNDLVDRVNRIVKLAGGKASGRFVGGNLTMVHSLMGTPYEVDTAGAILFLEDVHEEPYRIDRMLTTLSLAGKLAHLAAFVWGRCSDCKITGPSFSVEDILHDRFGLAPYPALSGLSFGHIEQKLTIPIGVLGTVDADAGRVTIDEPAVL
ncbi:MAG TPA: LD-carboxypeptidase [Thermoanaerobaculia bacterium]|nr:LD-carboxypeptidase [Thermoanaerobaculia bacterium]